MSIKICLDAGHVGKANRSPVVPEYYESDMVWKLHLMLKEELEKYGFEVITTRVDQNQDLSLYNRGYRAKGCDLFLSIHSNACSSESVDYPVVISNLNDNKYTFDEVSREIGTKLAKVIEQTMGTIQSGRMITKQSANDRDSNGIKDDEYYGVLNGAKAARVASMILEHSFHTNTKATKWLLNDNNLRLLAQREAKCLSEYYNQTKEVENNVNSNDFIEQIAYFVNKYKDEFGIKIASPIVAQAILESAKGTSSKAKYHNYFGLKYRENRCPSSSGYFVDGSAEQNQDGTYTNIQDKWFKFDNMELGVKGYFEFTNISNYKKLKGITDPRTYLEEIKAAGYATSLKYVDNVMNVIKSYDLTKYDQKEEVKKYYRVRKYWDDASSQKGAYSILDNAINNCPVGFSVFDCNGICIYTNEIKTHIVSENDTLTSISNKYGVSIDNLVQLNNLIKIGQELRIKE